MTARTTPPEQQKSPTGPQTLAEVRASDRREARRHEMPNGYETLCKLMLVASGNGDVSATAKMLREVTDAMPDDAFEHSAPQLRACASKLEAWADRNPEQAVEVADVVAEATRTVHDRKQAEFDAKLQDMAETDEQDDPGDEAHLDEPIDLDLNESDHGDEVHDPGDEDDSAREQALSLLNLYGFVSVSMIQRHVGLGYTGASQIIQQMVDKNEIEAEVHDPTRYVRSMENENAA